jgi:guanosine-3',5'-bis(diphosphate) 3'-pyrophosphohydrolase
MIHDTTFVLEALAFAAHQHRDQRRKGAHQAPYVNHCICVAHTLSSVGGVDDPTTLAAALLHDTLEDTDASARELEMRFGADVARIVQEVTDDDALPKGERKRRQVDRASSLSREARLVRLADKICNVRDIAHFPPTDWPILRRRAYLQWAMDVVAGVRGVNAALERLFDEEIARGLARIDDDERAARHEDPDVAPPGRAP